MNSNYDASFIAGILQLRYIYSMPVERIIKLFAEHGFEMNKATAHGLIKKRPVCLTWLKMFSRDCPLGQLSEYGRELLYRSYQ
ncbi:IS66 family transposase [Parabacteroides merdae]|uniref:IS66 family transposase n=1 Tax=Parabacteroides merdae TaxID=46503 RepID=UPI002F969AC2